MKILSSSQIRALDQFTISNQHISSIDLMERAANAFCNWMFTKFDSSFSILIIAGTGNNGGDGLAIARLLRKEGYSVKVLIIGAAERGSEDFVTNLNNLPKDISPTLISSELDITPLPKSDIIIDALFGSGLNRNLSDMHNRLVQLMNDSPSIKISVDVPSGMYCDLMNLPDDSIIKAQYTVTFQIPKLSFLFPENELYVGDWSVADIGLDEKFIEKQESDYEFVLKEDIQPKIKIRSKFSHKGTFGHALILAGSYGKIGAAALAANACLRTGVGLLTVQVPSCGYQIIQTLVPEALCLSDESQFELGTLYSLDVYNAVGIGPGIGKDPLTIQLFEQLLKNYKKPLVIDADGLNILSEHSHLLKYLPPQSILTPHPKEFERLTGKAENSLKRLELLKEFSIRNKCITILKGAYSAVCSSTGKVFFNSTGNPGMATGGSGDVLTGILTSLMAQGYEAIDAAIIGAYLHGYAGDCAAQKLGYESLIASDIINEINSFFKEINPS